MTFEVEGIEESDRLNGLAETHLIGENHIDFIAIRESQPVQAFQLIWMQLTTSLIQVNGLFGILFLQLKRG